MTRASLAGAFCAGLLCIGAGTSHATTVTQYGTDVSFTYDDASLFGTGTVVGNSIFFTPTNFKVESLDGAGLDTLSDTLNLTVMSTTSGFAMDMFALAEQGDYRLKGAPGASVDATAYFSVTSQTTNCGSFSCSDTGLYSAGALADTGGALALWNLGGGIDLANTSGWDSDSKVTITLQNNLLADTVNMGDIAFIQKKQGGIGIMINPIPVPAAVWLFGSGLAGLLGVARRKRHA